MMIAQFTDKSRADDDWIRNPRQSETASHTTHILDGQVTVTYIFIMTTMIDDEQWTTDT